MTHAGSINYLNFSPYQIFSQSQIPLTITSHWFLIRVLTSIINLTTFGNPMKIYFTSENMVANGWFKMYLNKEQQAFLKNSKKFELYPIKNLHKTSLLKSLENQNCYVYASSDWVPPPGAHIVSRITNTLSLVKNLTINKDVKNDDRILTIKPAPRRKLNNRYNSGFLQTHHQKSVYDHGIFAPIRSLHNIGLDGSGQVINIVDTGIDAFHPMFYDPVNTLSSISGKTNTKHRKILRIETYADNLDYYSGHGTHVSGIAAGNAYCTQDKCGISQYNGIAPGAKIYFSDIGFSQVPGDLSEEFDLSEQAKLLYSLDSYISSNSWSYDTPYREDMFIYDYSAYKNPNILYLFAAGNDYSYFTINSPSCAKNVASVGATNSVTSSSAEYSGYIQLTNGTYSIDCFERSDRIIRSMGLAEKMTYITNRPIVNYYINGSDVNPEDFKDKIVIMNADCITDNSRICNAYDDLIKRGAAACAYPTCFRFRCLSYPIPAFSFSEENLSEVMQMNMASIFPYEGNDDEDLPEAAALSSKGPSDMALSKPDFAVPGYQVISAKSHGTSENPPVTAEFSSNFVQMSGTSMATPAGSAIAIIIRQFFIDGFYPGLKKNSGKSITPSSVLIRSMIANSADKPIKLKTAEPAGPDFDLGFGIPCLERVFGYKGSGLRIVDNVQMASQNHHVYHIKLDSNSTDLIVTMTYLDPPLNPDNDAHFFADLDLVVKSPTGKYYVGNGVDKKLADSDSFSTSERVIINKEEIPKDGGDFEIHVLSNEYALESETISYSVVVNGPFEQTNFDKNPTFLAYNEANENDCIKGCNGDGKCDDKGFCKCNEGFTGISCNTTIYPITEGQINSDTYDHKKIKYYKISPKNPTPNLTFVDYRLETESYGATIFFCTSTDENPGKITNPEWECHQAKQNFYSTELSLDEKFKSLYLAIYTSYHKPVKVTILQILFSSKDRPKTPSPPKNTKKILFIVGYAVCGLIFALLITGLIIFIVKYIQKKKKDPIADVNEAIVATVNTYDVDATESI